MRPRARAAAPPALRVGAVRALFGVRAPVAVGVGLERVRARALLVAVGDAVRVPVGPGVGGRRRPTLVLARLAGDAADGGARGGGDLPVEARRDQRADDRGDDQQDAQVLRGRLAALVAHGSDGTGA